VSDITIREATAADLPAVLALLADSMARDSGDPRFEALYRWKHEENAFGESPAWVAVDGDRIAGLRVFMRWEFLLDGRAVRAVRAVDTATHPDYQGRGIFTKLTMHALDAVRADGVDFVFNTPNDQSRPGYLKMGWEVVGKLPVSVRPRSVPALARMVAARVPAQRWSAPSTAGEAAADVLADEAALASLLETQPVVPGLRTRVDSGFLRWRYGSPLLSYRAVAASGGVAGGLVLFRVRRRGRAREAVLCEVLAPEADVRMVRALVAAAFRQVDADYVMRLGGPPIGRDRFVRLPGQGPVLTRRAAASEPPAALTAWRLTLGDVELF
jgi:GNAT superfamily N-acetyltransferase